MHRGSRAGLFRPLRMAVLPRLALSTHAPQLTRLHKHAQQAVHTCARTLPCFLLCSLLTFSQTRTTHSFTPNIPTQVRNVPVLYHTTGAITFVTELLNPLISMVEYHVARDVPRKTDRKHSSACASLLWYPYHECGCTYSPIRQQQRDVDEDDNDDATGTTTMTCPLRSPSHSSSTTSRDVTIIQH
jgi:hypothetical protein